MKVIPKFILDEQRKDFELKEALKPKTPEMALRFSKDPSLLSKLNFTRPQMLQYGLDLKSQREDEEEMEKELSGGKVNSGLGGAGTVQGSFNKIMNTGKTKGYGGMLGDLEQASMRLGDAASKRRIKEEKEMLGLKAKWGGSNLTF